MKKRYKGFFGTLVLFTLVMFAAGCAPQQPQPNRPAQTQPQPRYFEHTITFSGETLADIALWYTGKAANWSLIQGANPGLKPDRLRIGQKILIPQDLVVNERPFTKTSLKRAPQKNVSDQVKPEQTPAPSEEPVSPTATPIEEEPTPIATVVPTASPTLEPTSEPVPPVATPAAKSSPSSEDAEREKLLDELLK